MIEFFASEAFGQLAAFFGIGGATFLAMYVFERIRNAKLHAAKDIANKETNEKLMVVIEKNTEAHQRNADVVANNTSVVTKIHDLLIYSNARNNKNS